MELQIIGDGGFSRWIQKNVIPFTNFEVVNIVTRSNGKSVVPDVPVYVCSPDRFHNEMALDLINTHHVLCEKPVTNIKELIAKYDKKHIFQINFDRRFLPDTILAGNYLSTLSGVPKIVFESYDPDLGGDLEFIVNNSMSHDFDTFGFITDELDLVIDSVTTSHYKSIVVKGHTNRYEVEFLFRKNNPTYTQLITINNEQVFGFDSVVNRQPYSPFNTYRGAYVVSFHDFEYNMLVGMPTDTATYLLADSVAKDVISRL